MGTCASSACNLCIWLPVTLSTIHLLEAMFDSLTRETPAWQQNGIIGQCDGIFLSLSSLRGFPLWWGEWKVPFNVLWRVAGGKRLKALHAAFRVGHFSPCGEWDVPMEFAIDCLKRKGLRPFSGWKCNKRTIFMM